MPDQDTLLEIIESYDLGDYLEMQAEMQADMQMQAEMQAEQEAIYETENDPYANWDWDLIRCESCGILPGDAPSEYCDTCSEGMAQQIDWDCEDDPDEVLTRNWHLQLSPAEAQAITKDHVETTRARADIIQAEADVARITADIAAANREIAYLKYDVICYHTNREYRESLSAAEINLVNTETCLVDAEACLAKARRSGVAYEAVTIKKKNVEDAEARVQDIIKIWGTLKDENHVEKSGLLTENTHIEYTIFSEQQGGIVKLCFYSEGAYIEYINSLIDLAEAKDALDLAETILTKTPSLSLTHGYGFASHEPRCPTSYIAE